MKTHEMIEIPVGTTLPDGRAATLEWCLKTSLTLPMFTFYDPNKQVLLVSQTAMREFIAPFFESFQQLAEGIMKTCDILAGTLEPVMTGFVSAFETPAGQEFLKACKEAMPEK